jgi:sugar O-acyltransferase (sialic acid O-acetyltransferase NeuD family)
MPSNMIFLYGAGGHAKVVADIVERQGSYEIAFLADDDPGLAGQEIYGYRVIGGRSELLAARARGEVSRGVLAIGSNGVRLRLAAELAGEGVEFVSAIHPSAQLARGVEVAEGTVIMGGAVINSDTRIAGHVIVNTGATVDHDCHLAEGVHVAPGATVCGGVTVGEGAFVGAGTTIIEGVTVGSGAMVGAGATVVRDVPDGLTVLGTPARPREV